MKRGNVWLWVMNVHLAGALVFMILPSALPSREVPPAPCPPQPHAAARQVPEPWPDLPPTDGSHLALLAVHDGGVEVEVVPDGRPGAVEVDLCRLDGEPIGRAARAHGGAPVRLAVAADVQPEHPDDYYLRWRSCPDAGYHQRSLLALGEILETTLVGQQAFLAGTRPVLRVLVRDHATDWPVAGATVLVTLTQDGGEIGRTAVRTDRTGEAALALPLPAAPADGVHLAVQVDSRTARDHVEAVIDVRSGVRTFLVTDRALYQPGQEVYLRGLSLVRPAMTPLADAEVVYEAEDGRGNMVFRQAARTDAFGVSHARVALADELNLGTWRVRATAGGTTEHREITVARYVPPAFKVTCRTDRPTCRPGDTVRADVQANYFFGKPVAGAGVAIRCLAGPDDKEIRAVRGKTDAAGAFRCTIGLPETLPGDPAPTGRTAVRLAVGVRDPAGHVETTRRDLVATSNEIVLTAVPEAGDPVVGVKKSVHVVATYVDGTPAPCEITWLDAAGRPWRTVTTDSGGFAEFHIPPAGSKATAVPLEARDARGRRGWAMVRLPPAYTDRGHRLVVRTDRSLYRVGDRVRVSVQAERQAGPAYLDVIADHQTCLTQTLDLGRGAASGDFVLTPTMTGPVGVNVYLLDADGGMTVDRRLILVEPADALHVAVEKDRDAYRPGDEAQIRFHVTDAKRQGVAAALGVIVFDEAVAAKTDLCPGDQKVRFYLEREITGAAGTAGGRDLASVFARADERDRHRDEAARVLLASVDGVGRYPLCVNTFQRDNKINTFRKKLHDRLEKHARHVGEALRRCGGHVPGNDEVIAAGDPPWKGGGPVGLADLVELGYLKTEDALDPWGHPLEMTGRWNAWRRQYDRITLSSAGIDGLKSTMDDVSVSIYVSMRGMFCVTGVGGGGRSLGFGRGFLGASVPDEDVRVREKFPETLAFHPAVITNAHGRAALTLPLADSITTWRMTCLASSGRGALGSATAGLRVFQDFFVDVGAPPSLMRGDEISLPVAIHNDLDEPQEVRVRVDPSDGFDLQDEPVQTVTLGPAEVRAVYFRVAARRSGRHKLTVFARGTMADDAVALPIEVVPDGRECLVAHTGRLDGPATHTRPPTRKARRPGRWRISCWPAVTRTETPSSGPRPRPSPSTAPVRPPTSR